VRILAISFLFPNSVNPNHGIFVLNRLRGISKYYEVKVINPIPWFPFNYRIERYRDFYKIPQKEYLGNIEVFHPRFLSIPKYLKLFESFSYFVSVFPLALKIHKVFQYDLIDVHWLYPDLPAAYILAKYLRKNQVTTLRGKEALFSTGMGLYRNIILPCLKRSDRIISLSQELVEICIADGVKNEKFQVIRNGVDTDRFYFLEKAACREKLGLPKDKRIILSVGSLIYRKGFDRIIRAFSHIYKKDPNARLYIIGSEGPEGTYRRELLQIINKYSLVGKIHLAGSVKNEDLLFWYNAADAFCLASRGEGSPNVLSEALACGCPSVSTDVGAVSEILIGKSMGVVVLNDDESLLRGLMLALSSKYDRREISRQIQQYNWDWCAKQVIRVYQEAHMGQL
jgi:glycosyltransferase involved in cell wall biosynthesis